MKTLTAFRLTLDVVVQRTSDSLPSAAHVALRIEDLLPVVIAQDTTPKDWFVNACKTKKVEELELG